MKIMQSQSTVRPPEWDLTSSRAMVYHNINITEQPATEDTPRMYNYTVEVYTREEYRDIVPAQNAERISLTEKAILALMDMGVMQRV